MSKIFLTSDTHFCHDRGFVYQPRGFSTIQEMNEAIVERWNSVVGPNDIVMHLGDIALNTRDVACQEYISKLNGHIRLLRGNHDTTSTYSELTRHCPNVFAETDNYAMVLKYGKYQFYLSHYPTFTSNLENDAPLSQHMINLYGHTHQQSNFYNDIPFMYHVGMDSHDCYPVEIEQVLSDIRAKVQECKDML